jgi:hypothetical protein
MPHHSKGLCPGCYNSVFHSNQAKTSSVCSKFGLTPENYEKLTKNCGICGWDKHLNLFHLDNNKNNNSEENLVSLCSNHGKMLLSPVYKQEIYAFLKEKGVKTPENAF